MMRVHAKGVPPVSMPGQFDERVGKFGASEVFRRCIVRIDPITDRGYVLESYFVVGRDQAAELIGMSVAGHYHPEPIIREFMEVVDASRTTKRLFDKVKLAALDHDRRTNDEMKRDASVESRLP